MALMLTTTFCGDWCLLENLFFYFLRQRTITVFQWKMNASNMSLFATPQCIKKPCDWNENAETCVECCLWFQFSFAEGKRQTASKMITNYQQNRVLQTSFHAKKYYPIHKDNGATEMQTAATYHGGAKILIVHSKPKCNHQQFMQTASFDKGSLRYLDKLLHRACKHSTPKRRVKKSKEEEIKIQNKLFWHSVVYSTGKNSSSCGRIILSVWKI